MSAQKWVSEWVFFNLGFILHCTKRAYNKSEMEMTIGPNVKGVEIWTKIANEIGTNTLKHFTNTAKVRRDYQGPLNGQFHDVDIVKILNLYIILSCTHLSLLSSIYPLPAIHSLLVTNIFTKNINLFRRSLVFFKC